MKKELSIKRSTHIQSGTSARRRAVRDPRNFIVAAAQTEKFMKNLEEGKVLNFDFLQYAVGDNGTLTKAYYINDEEMPNSGDGRQQRERERVDADTNGTYVKVGNCISDAGYAMNPVIVLQVDDLPADKMFSMQAKGISSSSNVKDYVTIIFVNSRHSMNKQAWDLILKQIMTFVDDIDDVLYDGNPATKGNFVLKVDGEDEQLIHMTNDNVKEDMVERNILLCKGFGSGSQVENELDAGVIHLASKQRNRHFNDLDWLQPFKVSALVAKMKECLSEYKDSSGNSIQLPCVTEAFLSNNAKGVIRVMCANEGILIPTNIRRSFEQYGASKPPAGCDKQDWDVLRAKLALKKGTPLTSKEFDTIQGKWPDVLIAIDKGFLTEQEMDEWGFPKSTDYDINTVDKDKRVASRQRGLAFVPDVFTKFRTYINTRNANADQKRQEKKEASVHEARMLVFDAENNAEGKAEYLRGYYEQQKSKQLVKKMITSRKALERSLHKFQSAAKEEIETLKNSNEDLVNYRDKLLKKKKSYATSITKKVSTYHRDNKGRDLNYDEENKSKLESESKEQVRLSNERYDAVIDLCIPYIGDVPPATAPQAIINSTVAEKRKRSTSAESRDKKKPKNKKDNTFPAASSSSANVYGRVYTATSSSSRGSRRNNALDFSLIPDTPSDDDDSDDDTNP